MPSFTLQAHILSVALGEFLDGFGRPIVRPTEGPGSAEGNHELPSRSSGLRGVAIVDKERAPTMG